MSKGRTTGDQWPRQAGGDSAENRHPFGKGTEGLCHTMPDLGTIPFMPDRALNRRVVRLVSTSEETDLSIELKPGTNKVGRQRVDNHIVLVGPEISRFHTEIDVLEEAIVIRDLGSSNGTFVNGERVGEISIQAGDKVAFSEQFSFQLLIDIAVETPDAMTLAASQDEPLPKTHPPESAPHDVNEVPTSLKRRSRALEEIASQEIQIPVPETPAAAPGPPEFRLPAPVASASPKPVAPPPMSPPPMSPPPMSPPPMSPAPTAPVLAPAASAAPPPPPYVEPPTTPVDPVPSAGSALPAKGSGLVGSFSEELGIAPDEGDQAEMAVLERERRQLAVLYQVSKRCMAAETLAELDRLLINVLERIVSFDRGFITYQLPTGDWKLVMSPKGDRWERKVVRKLLQLALKSKESVAVHDSRSDDTLGSPGPGRTDSRLLLPLASRSSAVGAVFLIASRAESFDDYTVDFLSLFADIAALAVVNCARLEGNA
jgi:FHA domain/GAF domain